MIDKEGAQMDMIKQIILVTDGCSNVGTSPIIAAAHAHAEGIVVNVIGILDHGDLGQKGAREVAEIAKAGGGLSRVVHTGQLSQTIQMMTRQTVAGTVRQTVQEELKRIMTTKMMVQHSTNPIDMLSPEQRSQVVEVMDEMVETVALRMCLLLDTSASMKSKWSSVLEAIRDLGLSLQARQGANDITIYRFPASSASKHSCEKLVNTTNQLANVGELFYNLEMRGTTPTGPAILEIVRDMLLTAESSHNNDRIRTQRRHTRDGLLSDYIV